MKALDLFCGAGGASAGLARAGYEVFGVDIAIQPNYPYALQIADALEWLRYVNATGPKYDLIWASPPCQAFTAYKRRHNHVYPKENLIPATRALLERSGVPWVIENVPGARKHLRDPVQLCGSSFGLNVRRHRLFETSRPIKVPLCDHNWQTPRFPPATNRTNLRSTVEVGVWRIALEVQQRAMGIDWMTREELSQAIPPAYAEHIGREMMKP